MALHKVYPAVEIAFDEAASQVQFERVSLEDAPPLEISRQQYTECRLHMRRLDLRREVGFVLFGEGGTHVVNVEGRLIFYRPSDRWTEPLSAQRLPLHTAVPITDMSMASEESGGQGQRTQCKILKVGCVVEGELRCLLQPAGRVPHEGLGLQSDPTRLSFVVKMLGGRDKGVAVRAFARIVDHANTDTGAHIELVYDPLGFEAKFVRVQYRNTWSVRPRLGRMVVNTENRVMGNPDLPLVSPRLADELAKTTEQATKNRWVQWLQSAPDQGVLEHVRAMIRPASFISGAIVRALSEGGDGASPFNRGLPFDVALSLVLSAENITPKDLDFRSKAPASKSSSRRRRGGGGAAAEGSENRKNANFARRTTLAPKKMLPKPDRRPEQRQAKLSLTGGIDVSMAPAPVPVLGGNGDYSVVAEDGEEFEL